MDVKKIGKFIAYNRKKKGLTQQQLADKLGVTNKTISRWENGNYMPDISLLKPLSEELDITLNELLSGESILEDEYQDKSEVNIVNTIDYSKQLIVKEKKKISYMIMIIGILISLTALIMFDSESSWSSIYSLLGMIIFTVALYQTLDIKNKCKKVCISIMVFLECFALFYLVDMISVIEYKRPPMYRYMSEYGDNMIVYHSGLYTVYRINRDSVNEYYIVDILNKKNESTIPMSFDRDKRMIYL